MLEDKQQEEGLATKLLQAWQQGKLCLHPSDTLPGLSFHPNHQLARAKLLAFKKRSDLKSFVSLVASLEQALVFWQPLPAHWRQFLQAVWPGPLTVIWRASSAAPRALVSEDGYVALRCPLWSPQKRWMQAVLQACGLPFPTTSVNLSGESAVTSWAGAQAYVAGAKGIFIPDFNSQAGLAEEGLSPSTLIKLGANKDYEILRAGALAPALIAQLMKEQTC